MIWRAAIDPSGSLRRACQGLLTILVAVNLAMLALLLLARDTWGQALDKTALWSVYALVLPSGSDSWGPMASAYHDVREGRDMYRVFFEGIDRFQYPPTALLLHEAVPGALAVTQEDLRPGTSFNRWASWLSRLCVIASIAAAVALLQAAAGRFQGVKLSGRDRAVTAAAFTGCALLFNPLLYPHALGQVQVVVNLLLILALLTWVLGAPAWAGLLVGMCALVKPQYALLLLWALVARQWRFAAAMGMTGAAGLMLSLMAFGLKPHLQYLEVLQFLSRHGESFWANQSVNGLMHRLLHNGDAREFAGFPPYNRLVHLATVASSLAILAVTVLALKTARRPSSGRAGHGDTLAFGAFLAATTLASPVAWEHHYGFFIGLAALLLPALVLSPRGGGPARLFFAAAFVAMASVFKHPNFLFGGGVLSTVLAMHLYWGGLVVLVLLIVEARRSAPERLQPLG